MSAFKLKKFLTVLILSGSATLRGDQLIDLPGAAIGANLLRGSSFECGNRDYTYGWAGYMREYGGYANMPAYVTAASGETAGRGYVSDCVDGEKSLQLTHPNAQVRTMLLSQPSVLPDKTGRVPAFFSIHMKAVDKPAEVTLSLYSGRLGESKQVATQKLKLTTSWQRYVIRGEVAIQVYAQIVFIGKGQVRLDAAMLEIAAPGKPEPSPYRPAEKFLSFVDTRDTYGIGFAGKPQLLTISIVNRERVAGKLSGLLTIVDYYGKTVFTRHLNFADRQYGQKQEVNLACPATGYYKAVFALEHEQHPVTASECAFAIVPQRDMTRLEDTPFGMHTWPTAQNLTMLKMIGVSMIRDHLSMLTKWMTIEPAQGKFQNVDRELERIRQAGLGFLGSLDYTPLWASTIRPEYPALKKFNMPADLWYYARLYPPRNPTLMIPYIKYAVGRYRKFTNYWETWNEVKIIDNTARRQDTPFKSGFIHLTMDELLTSSALVYRTVKGVNPDAVVVGQYVCHEPYSQLLDIIKAGGLKHVDKLAVHFYQGQGKGIPPDEPSERGEPPLRQRVEQWREQMKISGREVGLWDTEFGLCRTRSNYHNWNYKINWDGVTPATAISYIVKSYLVRLSLGFEKVFYYSTFRPNYLYSYEPFIEFDFKPQPATAAFAVMTNLFDGAKFYPDLLDDRYAHILKAGKERQFIYAIWLKNAGAGLRFRLSPEHVGSILNVMGNKISGTAAVTTEPLYIVTEKEIGPELLKTYHTVLKTTPSISGNVKKANQPYIENTGL